MGTKAKAVTGARAILKINSQTAGIFSNVSTGVSYGSQDVYVLGNYAPSEIVYTDQEVISITCSGFRVMGNGPYVIGSVPKLQELLQHQDIELQLIDRQESDSNKQVIMNIIGVRPVGFETSTSARGLQDLTIRFKGLLFNDETGAQSDPGATTFG
jgi:hypothetical protein